MLDDSEEFINIIGEYLDARLCRGLSGQQCYSSAVEEFAMMCSLCAYVAKYTFCKDHSKLFDYPLISLRMGIEEGKTCTHWIEDGGISTVFILTREPLLP